MSAVVAAVCLGDARAVRADSEYRVTLTSQPKGATVWIDDRAADPAGETPLDVSLGAGTHTIYIELKGHEVATKEIRVKKRRRGRQRFSMRLVELQTGSIDVLAAEGSDVAMGATVRLDGEEVGTVPDSFDAVEGSHEIEVMKDGFAVFKRSVEVGKGKSVEVLVALQRSGGDPPDEEVVDEQPPPPNGGTVVVRPPRRAGLSPIALQASLGAGFRFYVYDQLDNDVMNLFTFEALGIALAEIGVEFRLGGVLSSSVLRPLSLFAAVSLSAPVPSRPEETDETISAIWFRREVGLRVQFPLSAIRIGVDVAEVGDTLTFLDVDMLPDMVTADLLPELRYEYIRIGGFVGVDLGDTSLGAGGDGLLFLRNEGVVDVFADDEVVGFRAYLWLRQRFFGALDVSLSGRFTQVAHTFTNPEGQAIANGAYDRMIDAMLNIAYQF